MKRDTVQSLIDEVFTSSVWRAIEVLKEAAEKLEATDVPEGKRVHLSLHVEMGDAVVAVPSQKEFALICKANGRHEWYNKRGGGYYCRQCGFESDKMSDITAFR